MTSRAHSLPYTALRLLLLAAVATVAVFNGQGFSPIFDSVLFLLTPLLRGTFSAPMSFFYATSAFIALMTFVIAGLPAAIYERIRGQRTSTVVSLLIWLAAAALLTLPAYRAWQDVF